jgi:hypothetical protein
MTTMSNLNNSPAGLVTEADLDCAIARMTQRRDYRSERHAALQEQDFADTNPTREPFLYGSPTDVRRTGHPACVTNRCASGRRQCPTPDACRLPEDDARFGAIEGLLAWLALVTVVVVALCAAAVLLWL